MPNEIWWRDIWWLILFFILALPFSSVVAFGAWMRRQKNIEVDVAAKYWDIFIKLMSALTVIVTGAMLFGKYIDQIDDAQRLRREAELHAGNVRADQEQRDHNLRVAEFLRLKLQFDLERYQRQKQLLGEAKTLAADLATNEVRDNKWRQRFEELYYADLIGVEQDDGPVETAMVRFRRKLNGLPKAPDDSLNTLSLELSAACEQELKEAYSAIVKQQEKIVFLTTANPTSPLPHAQASP